LEPRLFRYIWTHSRRDQLIVLAMILASLPFYWVSLDIPKQIVNEAIQGRAFKGKETAVLFDWSIHWPDFLGGGTLHLSDGWALRPVSYLMALSGLFLLYTLVNGAFKYYINVHKGILAERMLRRLRFDLFSLLLRLRPEDIRGIKPAEAASIIKDEVEPIGGFIGDAFIQPAFLGTQALTALLFIVMQNAWLGLLTAVILAAQVVIVPVLRREQLRLGRERQIQSRRLAGRIGEIVDTAPAAQIHGVGDYHRAEIGGRLATLFSIRFDLYKRKFAVKYINNMLAQLTPFFFYAIGGFFALRGSLDIGQLVAVIAAYRDLPPPIKELIDWDQMRNDITIKYEQVVSLYSGKKLAPQRALGETIDILADAPIEISDLTVPDSRGGHAVENFSRRIEQPSHVALVGPPGSGRDALARTLGRQITEYEGSVRIGDFDLHALAPEVTGSFLAYCGVDHYLAPGSIRENVAISLKRRPPALIDDEPSDAAERLRRLEAMKTGNPIAPYDVDWIDYEAAGLSGPEALDPAIIAVLRVVGLDDDIYRMGLMRKIDPARDPRLTEDLLRARQAVRQRMIDKDMTDLIEPFDTSSYNASSTIGDNLLFGELIGERLNVDALAANDYFRMLLDAEALTLPLVSIGARIATTTLELFADLPPNHPLFERYSFIRASDMSEYRTIVELLGDVDRQPERIATLPRNAQSRLIALALSYIEPRHRLSLMTEALQARILRARLSLRRFLPSRLANRIEFYDAARLMKSATIRDNLIFGRVRFGKANAEHKIEEIIRSTMIELGLDTVIYGLGLDTEVGIGGRAMLNHQRAGINVARNLIKRPTLCIVDGALAAYSAGDAKRVIARLRQHLAGRTFIATLNDPAEAEDFDRVLVFEGSRLVADRAGKHPSSDAVVAAAAPSDSVATDSGQGGGLTERMAV
jgi:putative ABC transport system ATP-binding protein